MAFAIVFKEHEILSYTDVEEFLESQPSLSTVFPDRNGLGPAQTTLRQLYLENKQLHYE